MKSVVENGSKETRRTTRKLRDIKELHEAYENIYQCLDEVREVGERYAVRAALSFVGREEDWKEQEEECTDHVSRAFSRIEEQMERVKKGLMNAFSNIIDGIDFGILPEDPSRGQGAKTVDKNVQADVSKQYLKQKPLTNKKT